MSEPVDGSEAPPITPDSQVAPPPPDPTPAAPSPASAQPAATASTATLFSRLDMAGQLIAAGSAVAIVVLVLGLVVGAWSFGGYALVILVAALVALAIVLANASKVATDGWPVPGRDLVIVAGVVMSVLAVLNMIEVAFDLDEIDDERGGVVGLILTIALAVASFMVLLGGMRARPITALATSTVRNGSRGIRLALGGLALELLAWLVMLTISVYSLGPSSSFELGLSVIAVLVLVLGANPEKPWRLPIPASWIAVGLSLVAAFMLIDLFDQFGRANDRFGLDLIDTLAFYAHAIGTLLILAGSVLAAVDQMRAARPAAPAAPAAPASGGPAA